MCVFLRDDAVHKSLKPPYEGPYKVLEPNSKVFIMKLPGREVTVSIDRLKPAFMIYDPEDLNHNNACVQCTDNTGKDIGHLGAVQQ